MSSANHGHRYGVVGNGRLAHHLCHYFTLQGLEFSRWSRSQFARSGIAPNQALAHSDIILLMVADGAIAPCMDRIRVAPSFASRQYIHFSGALTIPGATGCHPLMSFGSHLYDHDTYTRIPFVCEEGGDAFTDVFPMLPNPHYLIRVEDKSFYHCLCVMAGNFSVILWQKLFSDLDARLGIPSSAALPYLQQVTVNLAEDFRAALTGPFARNDHETLRANLAALQGDAFQSIYNGFMAAFAARGKHI